MSDTLRRPLLVAVLYLFTVTVASFADDCHSNPCLHGGTCRKYSWSRKYHCLCNWRNYGDRCQHVSPCVGRNPCQNGGSCVPAVQAPGFRCVCPRTHLGEMCERENQCFGDRNPCQNGGTCRVPNWATTYYCFCPNGFGGKNCQFKSRCDDNPCQNGGTCRDTFLNNKSVYKCDCPENKKGKNCEFADPCSSSPCQNGGTCKLYQSDYGPEPTLDYYCSCSSMYHGEFCQNKTGCKTKNCYNGVCYSYGSGQTECVCRQGFRPPTCQHQICRVDKCPSSYYSYSGYTNCTVDLRAEYEEMRQCARKRYADLKKTGSCDCTPDDAGQTLWSLLHHADDYDTIQLKCLSRATDEELNDCAPETRECVELLKDYFQDGGSSRCNETMRRKIMGCLSEYDDGKLDLRSCSPSVYLFNMAREYRGHVTLSCSGCRYWEFGRHCTDLPLSASLSVICLLFTKKRERDRCILRKAQDIPECQPVIKLLEDELRHRFRGKTWYHEVCGKLAEYKKMWTEEWGCDAEHETSDQRATRDLQDWPWFHFAGEEV